VTDLGYKDKDKQQMPRVGFLKYEREGQGSRGVIIRGCWYSKRLGGYCESGPCHTWWSTSRQMSSSRCNSYLGMVGTQLIRSNLLQQNVREFWFSSV